MTRIFNFIGVTTGQSSIMRIFPVWRDLLGLGSDVNIEGIDLPIHGSPEGYRDVVELIKHDRNHLGALVTTHKIDLYQATLDVFDDVDYYARLCGELSCIANRGGRLLGWAKDPISAGKSLDRILGPGYFGRTKGHVLCFGAGGSGVAITLHLLTRPGAVDRPVRIVVTNRSSGRLHHLESILQTISSDVAVEYVHSSDVAVNDRLMAQLPAGSVVINATGMGKDVPGSPVSADTRFPQDGVAWEINYRGDLDFLHQAWSQRDARGIRVEDGWEYFIFGWTSVMEEVFSRRFSNHDIAALSDAAAFARPPLPTSR